MTSQRASFCLETCIWSHNLYRRHNSIVSLSCWRFDENLLSLTLWIRVGPFGLTIAITVLRRYESPTVTPEGRQQGLVYSLLRYRRVQVMIVHSDVSCHCNDNHHSCQMLTNSVKCCAELSKGLTSVF